MNISSIVLHPGIAGMLSILIIMIILWNQKNVTEEYRLIILLIWTISITIYIFYALCPYTKNASSANLYPYITSNLMTTLFTVLIVMILQEIFTVYIKERTSHAVGDVQETVGSTWERHRKYVAHLVSTLFLLLAFLGAVYWHSNNPQSDISVPCTMLISIILGIGADFIHRVFTSMF